MLKRISFLVLFIILLDLILAQVAKVTINFWDVSKIEIRKLYPINDAIQYNKLSCSSGFKNMMKLKRISIYSRSF